VVIGLLLSAVPALGHHSFTAEFDASNSLTLKGTITKVDWVNPHVYLYLDVKDESGSVVNWQIESWPPGLMHKSGLTREKLSSGQEVTILAVRAKDITKSLGWLKNVKFSDGSFFELGNQP
jgi:hypothetical protein